MRTIIDSDTSHAGQFPHMESQLKMNVRKFSLGGLLLAAALVVPAWSEIAQQSDNGGQTQAPTTTQTATLPPQSAQTQGSAPLRVMVGKSLLINTTERLKRISVTDPSIAYATPVTPTQILVHGKAPGEVSLLIWDELERSRSFDLRVDVDVSACAEEEHRVFPDEQIRVTPSRAAVVLSGHVSTEDVAKRAGDLASAYSPKVVNVLTFGPVGSQEVLLQVKFAEVDRTALTQLGINFISTGASNTIGTVTTGQFGGFGPQQITTGSSGSTGESLSNVLNLFVFRPDINFGAVIQALETKNLLQILAEPNLIAVNGKKASFLAGGQFPFPIVQPGNGFTAVTISFKEFGVRLEFTPVIMPNGNIHLQVAPEVSTLDFANALTISGFTVPALSTRKADTEFEVQDGQSFVIAGLMDNRVTDIYNKIPGLGDIPILGNFFRSKSLQKSNSELMVLCTVKRVSPTTETPTGPKNPKPYMDTGKFDKSR
ncbi:MAG TPA: type II and III secretion system protein family protein [Candidatus Sulfotelmatobacter sp.]|jgi:pilus assembly protein CpaC|nr:type II and III secretion system protein family protein [Candidatus Sulfotelmatobacter sp.]